MKGRIVTATLIGLLATGVSFAEGLPDFANLKVLKVKTQMLTLQNQGKDLAGDAGQVQVGQGGAGMFAPQDGCGTIRIGDLNNQQTIGQDLTIVVTGDIINAGNRCR